MPSIHINGLRGGADAIRAFREELKAMIARVENFELTPKDINVYILHEYAQADHQNITIEVRGLTTETTLDEQNDLAKIVHDAIRAFLHRPEYVQHYDPVDRVEVFVIAFDPEEQGYASSRTSRPSRSLKLVE